jgi:hypothetical protein
MYMEGRFLTASSPSKTWMVPSLYMFSIIFS